MGAVSDFRRPTWLNPLDEDLDWIRDNYNFLLCCAAAGAVILPDWDTLVDVSDNNDYSEPDSYILTRGTRAIHIRFTWSAGVKATVQICYDNGVSGGAVCFAAVSLVQGDLDLITTSLDYFATVTESSLEAGGAYWDWYADLEDGFQEALYDWDFGVPATTQTTSEYLICKDPTAGLALSPTSLVQSIRFEIQAWADSGLTASITDTSLAGQTVQDSQSLTATPTVYVFDGDLAYWGITNEQALDFASGIEAFQFRVTRTIPTASPHPFLHVTVDWVKCRFIYSD